MTVDTYEIMCAVINYVEIGIHTYAEIADVLTMNLIYHDAVEEKIDARIRKAFPNGSVV